jgi:hypothetical protein
LPSCFLPVTAVGRSKRGYKKSNAVFLNCKKATLAFVVKYKLHIDTKIS